MNASDCFELGIIKRPYSFKGELVMKVTVDDPALYLDLDRVFVEEREDLVPYFVERLSSRPKSEFRLKLEDVDSEDDVRSLSGCRVMLPVDEQKHEEDDRQSWMGFEVIDREAGNIGSVSGYLDIPGNPQIEVTQAAHVFMIPLNAGFVQSIDETAQTIHTELPDGLLDLAE